MNRKPSTPTVRPPAWSYWPAIVVLAGCGLLTLVVVFTRSEPSVTTLQRRADAAVRAKDLETAVLTYQHILALEPGKPAHVIAFARTLDQLGKRAEAINILGTVAPETADGEPAAHLLMASWLIEARVLGGQQDLDLLHRAIRHADRAATSASLSREADEQKAFAQAMLDRAQADAAAKGDH
ncbi:MAG: tetratricopeptide repeat protein [Tepidisphaeraceae bacterium]